MTEPADTTAPTASPQPPEQTGKAMMRLVLELVRPYRGWLIVVFGAMLLETAMSLAAPWPLKIILDNVVGRHKLPEMLTWLRDFSFGSLADMTLSNWDVYFTPRKRTFAACLRVDALRFPLAAAGFGSRIAQPTSSIWSPRAES